MKNRLKYLLCTVLCAICVAACSKDETVVIEPIGSYTFGEKQCDIMTGRYAEDDYGYHFVFSPLLPSAPQTTKVYFAIAKYFTGAPVDVSGIYHNDDYAFSYEDPVCYYSQYRSLKSGTVSVKALGNGGFEIMLDVILPDGTPFYLDFSGTLEQAGI